jgi:hypothetical protein
MITKKKHPVFVFLSQVWAQTVRWWNNLVVSFVALFSRLWVKKQDANFFAGKKANAMAPILMVEKTLDNPGNGDCLFYATSLLLIKIIHYEAALLDPQRQRQLANRWRQLDPLITYEQLVRFTQEQLSDAQHIPEHPARMHWDMLQQSLRRVLFHVRLTGIQAAIRMNELARNPAYQSFVARYTHPERNSDYNPFGGDFSVIEREFTLIREQRLSPRELDDQLMALFLRLFNSTASEIPPLVAALRASVENHVWGTDDDLYEIAEALNVNLDVQSNIQETVPQELLAAIVGPKRLDRHTLTLRNYNNGHWVSVIPQPADERDRLEFMTGSRIGP